MDTVLRFITVFLIFILVLFISHFTTKFVGNFQSKQYSGGNIKLLEAKRLNSSTYIQIIQVAGRVLVLSVSKDNVNTLCELSEDEYKKMCEEAPQMGASGSVFSNILSAAKSSLPDNKN